MISTNDLLSSRAAAPAAGAAASKQVAMKNEDASETTFATVLAETANTESQATQPVAAATSNTATSAATTQAAAEAAGVDTSTAGEASDTADATATADPAALLAGILTPAQTATTGALGLPASGLVAAADGADAPVDGATLDGATKIAPGLPQGATQPASAAAPATPPATTMATDPALQSETPAIDGETASTQTPADGDKPSKASASTKNASASATTATNTQANAAAQVQADIPVDAAAAQQKAAAVETVTAATTTSAPEALRASATNTPAQAAAPAATVQVYTRMIERFDGRAQRFEVRLDPAELGRVDVRIEVGADKKVHAVLAAHDSAALTDLMRGQRALERALTDAGFDLADGGVKFQLASDSNHNAQTGKGDTRSPSSPNVWRSFNSIDLPAEAASSQAATPWRHTRLDLVA